MKKILFLLLFTVAIYGQTYQNPTFGTVKTMTAPTVTTAPHLATVDTNGVISKITPSNLPVSTETTNALELKTTVSSGAVSGFELTNNGNGTVNIASGIAYLRSTNDPYANIIKYPISAVTNLALTDNANNYVLVDYNGGIPTITVTTNGSTINTQTNSIAYVIARVGNDLEYLNLVGQNVDPNAKIRIRFLNQEGIRRASGAILGFSNRNLTLTSSVLFSGLIKINAAAFNTTSPDTFTLAYNNGATWTRTTAQTQVNNTQYNVSGVLTTMPNNTFRTDYVYLLPNNPSKLYVIMGTTTYGSLTLAKGAPRPSSLPVELQVLGLEVGRLFIEKNSASIAEVQSSFANDFVGASVPEHNSLSGLQGGTAGEYNHLTNAQIGLVNDINPASAQFNTLYHQTIATSTGTVSSVGTNWTGTTTSLTANMEGGYVEVSGVGIAIIASVNVGAQTFTTLQALNTNVTNSPFEIHYKAYKAGSDGVIRQFRSSDGEQVAYIESNGDVRYNGLRIDSNGNVISEGFVFVHGDISLRSNGEIISRLSTLTPYTVATLPTPDSSKPAFAMVNDALNPVTNTAVVGGGTETVPVFFNGTGWLVNIADIGISSIANVWVESNGNDSTAELGNKRKPYLTIDAALDALPISGGVVNIGIGVFSSPTSSKIKTNTAFIGSKEPVTDAVISIATPTSRPSYTNPTRLVNGTILRGQFSALDKNNIRIENLGVDVGSYWTDTFNSGVKVGGLIIASLVPSTPVYNSSVNNVTVLGYSPTTADHCFLFENIHNSQFSNLTSYYNTHGLVLKGYNLIVDGYNSFSHGADALIVKSDTYAPTKNIVVNNVNATSLTGYESAGIILEEGVLGSSPLEDVSLSNINLSYVSFGLRNTNTVRKINVNNFNLYDSSSYGVRIDVNAGDFNLSGINIDKVSTDGLDVSLSSGIVLNISNINVSNATGVGYRLTTASNSIINLVNSNTKNTTDSYLIVGSGVFGNSNFGTGTYSGIINFKSSSIYDNGNVGIGVIPTSSGNFKKLSINGTDGSVIDLQTNGIGSGYIYSDINGTTVEDRRNKKLTFKTNGIERLGIESDGVSTFLHPVVIKQQIGVNNLISFLNSSGVASGEITISGTGVSLNLYSGVFSGYLTANGYNVNSSGQGFYSSDTGSYFAPVSGGWSSIGKITYANTESITDDKDLTPKVYVDRNRLKTYTFSTLPSSPNQGDSYAITDALTPTYLGTATGGGAIYAPVVWNGTAWVCH